VVRDEALLRRFENHRDAVLAGQAAPENVIPAVFGRVIEDNTF
jgi:hypothetical protein